MLPFDAAYGPSVNVTLLAFIVAVIAVAVVVLILWLLLGRSPR